MMNTSMIKNRLSELKFYGMQHAFQAYLQTGQNQLSGLELLDHLLQQEWEFRQNRNISTRIRQARFRYQASIEQVDCTAHRNLSKDLLLKLADCSFIEKKESILITGPTGVGKSYIASAIGHQACMLGYKVLYFNTLKLFSQLKMARADDTYLKELNRIEKHHLLILDDFGLQVLDKSSCLSLLEIIEHGGHLQNPVG